MKIRSLCFVMLSAFFTLMPFHGNTTHAITETGAQEASLPQIVTGSNAPVTAKKAALALPLEASHSWWARVQDDIRASEYKVSRQNQTSLQARQLLIRPPIAPTICAPISPRMASGSYPALR